jgi:hypothetical protein
VTCWVQWRNARAPSPGNFMEMGVHAYPPISRFKAAHLEKSNALMYGQRLLMGESQGLDACF